MTPHEHPTSPGPDDDRLRALLHGAVDDVHPRDGLVAIRQRTRRRSTGRRWAPLLVAAGAVAATVVGVTVGVGGLGGEPAPGPTDDGAASGPSADAPATRSVAVYFLSDTPTGPRLHREFHQVPDEPGVGEVEAALAVLSADRGPDDPDYRTTWPAGSFAEATVESDRIRIELGTDAALRRPRGVARGEDWLGVQQAVYTAEAALGRTLPVAFEWQGTRAERVLGYRVGALVERDRLYSTTAPVNVNDPVEGLTVSGSFVARGALGGYLDAMRWTLSRDGEVVRQGRARATSRPDDAVEVLGWETGQIDVAGLEPGDYVFTAEVTDVGQTSDSPAVFTDTRTITVR